MFSVRFPLKRLWGDDKHIAEYINNIGSGLDAAVENSVKNERMKTELITNVSHDLKTPLTSIISYVDLLKRENFTEGSSGKCTIMVRWCSSKRSSNSPIT